MPTLQYALVSQASRIETCPLNSGMTANDAHATKPAHANIGRVYAVRVRSEAIAVTL